MGRPNLVAQGRENWPQTFPLTESVEVKEEMKKAAVLIATTAMESVDTIGQAIDIEDLVL